MWLVQGWMVVQAPMKGRAGSGGCITGGALPHPATLLASGPQARHTRGAALQPCRLQTSCMVRQLLFACSTLQPYSCTAPPSTDEAEECGCNVPLTTARQRLLLSHLLLCSHAGILLAWPGLGWAALGLCMPCPG